MDERSTHLDMMRRYGRAPRGQRVYVKQRRNWGKNMTRLAGMTLDGMTESLVIEGSVTTPVFEAFIEQVLLPTLSPGDLVVLDNLGAHKSSRVEQLLREHGCQLVFLPAYSPDFRLLNWPSPKLSSFCVMFVPRPLILSLTRWLMPFALLRLMMRLAISLKLDF